jgi:transcription initiation factor TFIIIB Brf1 subunit/transcription initiation factor TFIIB
VVSSYSFVFKSTPTAAESSTPQVAAADLPMAQQHRRGACGWTTAARRLDAFSSELRLAADVAPVALRFLRAVLHREPDHRRLGPRVECYVACCLLLAARTCGDGGMLSIREIAACARCSDSMVLRRWPQVVTKLKHQGRLHLPSTTLRVQPAELVERYCEVLRTRGSEVFAALQVATANRATVAELFSLTGGVRKLSRSLLALAGDECLIEGRTTSSVDFAAKAATACMQ